MRTVKRHLFFDLDGTIIDSAPTITQCLRAAISSLGERPPVSSDLRSFIGTSLPEIFASVLPDPSPARVRSAVTAYIEHFEECGFTDIPVFPGMQSALLSLGARGHSLYLATSKGQDVAERVVTATGLSVHFAAVHGTCPDSGRTSKEGVLRDAFCTHGLDPTVTVMIGDRYHDVDAALAVGARAVGVSWGYGSPNEMKAAHAVANHPEALIEAISTPA